MRRRGGNFSVVRIGTIIAVLGLVVIAGGIVSFYIDQGSHKVPLDIQLYPGSVPAGQRMLGETTRREYFRVSSASPDEVAAYYNQKLYEHNNSQDEHCVRTPPVGEFETGEIPNSVPFEYICMFDRSGFRTSQYTKVTIQPGLYNADPQLNNLGMTIVEYEQYWQPG